MESTTPTSRQNSDDSKTKNSLLDLEGFLDRPIRNAYIYEPGLKIYVRKSYRLFDTPQTLSTLDLANIQADNPGNGAFTAFLKRLPSYDLSAFDGIYVESVLNTRLADKLRRWGFRERCLDPTGITIDFYCTTLFLQELASKL